MSMNRDIDRLREQLESIKFTEKASDGAYGKVLSAALKLLGRKMYTTHELRDKLRERELGTSSDISKVIARLEELKLLDDAEYARSWIQSRTRVNPKGPYVIRMELKKKKVEQALVDAALAEVEDKEKDLALELARKKLGQLRGLSHEKQYQRIMGLLQRRGFSYGTTKEIWQELRKDLN